MIEPETDGEGKQYGDDSSGKFWAQFQDDIFLEIHCDNSPFFGEFKGFLRILSNML